MSSIAAAAQPHDGEPAGEPGEGVVIPLAGRRLSAAAVASAGYHALDTDGSLALKAVAPIIKTLPAPAPPSTDTTRTATIIARALLEVLSGWRPPSQLMRWTSFSLQQDLERRAPRRPSGIRLQLVKVRVNEQPGGAAEVCALARDPGKGRVRVLALRMERRADSWVVTRLQAG